MQLSFKQFKSKLQRFSKFPGQLSKIISSKWSLLIWAELREDGSKTAGSAGAVLVLLLVELVVEVGVGVPLKPDDEKEDEDGARLSW